MNINYFEWFELIVSFNIDPKILKHKYIEKSKQLHPDKQNNSIISNQKTAINNLAYQTIKNRTKRLWHILTFLGVATTNENYTLDMDFMIMIMDMNETIENISESITKKKQIDLSIMSNLQRQYENLQQDIDKQLEFCLTKNVYSTLDNIDVNNLKKIKELLYKEKYVDQFAQKWNVIAKHNLLTNY